MCDIVWCRAVSGVKCGDAMWNGVVHGECGGVLMQDVVVEYQAMWNGLTPDLTWCDAEWWLKCSVECVLWDSAICNLHLNVVMCMVWCEVECGHYVEWCAEMWRSDLMWIMVQCEMWCDVKSCNFRHGVMWKVIEMQMCDVEHGVVWCGLWCSGMWYVT